MAEVLKALHPVEGLPEINIFPSGSGGVFIQKIFPSARFISRAASLTAASGTIYTVPTGKIFLLLSATLSLTRALAGGITGNNALFHVSTTGQFNVMCRLFSPNVANANLGQEVITFSHPVAFFADESFQGSSTNDSTIEVSVMGFEVDRYEWDKFITPQP